MDMIFGMWIVRIVCRTGSLEMVGRELWRVYRRDRFYVHERIIAAVRWVEFVSDGMSYMILRGRLCNIIVLNVHTPFEDKSNDVDAHRAVVTPTVILLSETV
jgi:hypothetical protein